MVRKLVGLLVFTAGFLLGDDPQPELDVPFEPTHPEVAEAMLKLAGVTAQDVVYDLGCGDGRIVIMAAKKFGARGRGVDIDPQRVEDAQENAAQAGVADRVTFTKGDLKTIDLTEATVVTLYLLNSVNLEIRPKLLSELKPGTRIVSHAFHMDDWDCDKKLTHRKARSKTLYFWEVPAGAGGLWTWRDLMPGKEGDAELALEQEFQTVTGTLTATGLKGKVKGSLAGRTLTLSGKFIGGEQPVMITLEGVVTGNVVEGTQAVRTGSDVVKRPWRATSPPVSLIGDWQLSARSSSGRDLGILSFSNTGGKLTAAYLKAGQRKPVSASALYTWGESMRCEFPQKDGEAAIYTGTFRPQQGRGTAYGSGIDSRLLWKAARKKG